MRMKGQENMMEYILMTFFIMVTVVALILFLSWWQVSQANVDKAKDVEARGLILSKYMLNDLLFVNDNALFDDGKLTGLSTMQCKQLQSLYGSDWFLRVKTIDSTETLCSANNYPTCDMWEFCYSDKPAAIYLFPVNIEKKVSGMVELGTLEVGVYYR